jgi:acyl-CoA-binding protein
MTTHNSSIKQRYRECMAKFVDVAKKVTPPPNPSFPSLLSYVSFSVLRLHYAQEWRDSRYALPENRERHGATFSPFTCFDKPFSVLRLHTEISDSLRLLMYGLTKQVKSGDCPSEDEIVWLMREGKLTMQGKEKTQRAKLKAWRSLKGRSSEEAMLMYIEECVKLGLVNPQLAVPAPTAVDPIQPIITEGTAIVKTEGTDIVKTEGKDIVDNLESMFRHILELYEGDEIMNAWRMLQKLEGEIKLLSGIAEESVSRIRELMKQHSKLLATMEERNGFLQKSLKVFVLLRAYLSPLATRKGDPFFDMRGKGVQLK